jgi:peptide/nickel transport system substrate-binding protein
VLAALTDGPIDAHDFTYTPILIEDLPTRANGGVQTRTVRVSPGETVVDALGRVQPLAAGLTLFRPDGTLLAYNGAAPVDLPQTEVVFHLRPNLRWSDGAPLTAQDSVFAYELGRSPDSTDPLSPVAARTQRYTARDDLTVVWIGLPGDVDPMAFTYLWPPLPRHLWSSLSPVEIADSEQANRRPLSFGPFQVKSWAEGGPLVLVRNPYYWRAAEGLPRMDLIEVVFVEDGEVLAEALQTGRCQLAPSGPLLDEAAPALVGLNTVLLQHVPGPVLEHLDFNLLPAEGPSIFADARVRQGLADCLDRAALAPYPGEPVPDSYLPPGHPLIATEVAHYPFDPARGRALLAESGWPSGQAFTLSGGPAGNPARAALLEAVARQWHGHCGLNVNTTRLTEGELLGDWPAGVLFGRRYDVALFGWRVGVLPPCALYTSLQIASDASPGGANAAGYADPAFDDACRRAVTAVDDAASAQAHAEAQRRLAADLAMLPLFFRPRHGAAAAVVQGYMLDGT